MPRLQEVSRKDVRSPLVLEAYAKRFGDRDPVTEPGTLAGTPGHWWTVFALDPDLFEVMANRQKWQFDDARKLDPVLREFGCTLTGWLSGSIFVYSQHCKVLRKLGVSEERIAGVTSWSTQDCYSTTERLVLGYTEDVVGNGGRVSDARFVALQSVLSNVEILELTFVITTYVQSSLLCRALRLEFDDRPESVVEQG